MKENESSGPVSWLGLEDNGGKKKLLSDIYVATFYVKKNKAKDFSTDMLVCTFTYIYLYVEYRIEPGILYRLSHQGSPPKESLQYYPPNR